MGNRPENVAADAALERLAAGNERYSCDKLDRPSCDAARREELVGGQSPFATVLTCADSRVAPEHVFDQGLGDLFVIRVAGNVADPAVVGSIEFATLHLGVNLVVVMGHRGCAAVQAAVSDPDGKEAKAPGQVDAFIEPIRPAARAARDAGGSGDPLVAAVKANAELVAKNVGGSPVMSDLAGSGVGVRAAYYDLATGRVEFL